MNKEDKNYNYPIKIAYPREWKSLTPALQHTNYGDAIILNIFEPLVSIDRNGNIEPLAASSWQIDEQFKKFIFKIDTKKKFSNGETLKAKHIKESWEFGLSLNSESYNPSGYDALYGLVDFESFKKTKRLDGVQVIGDDTLVLNFKKPFRRALERLSGGRYAPFIYQDGKYFGTGRYQIGDNTNEATVELNKNIHHTDSSNTPEAIITVLPPEKACLSLKNGDIDIYEFASLDLYEECKKKNIPNIGLHIGQESQHLALLINGQQDSIFYNKKLRLAFQYLFHKTIKENINFFQKDGLDIDPQPYLPFQAGRISEEKANMYIEKGSTYMQELISRSIEEPIHYLTSSQSGLKMLNTLKETGLKFTDSSGLVTWSELLQYIYGKKNGCHLIHVTFSISSNDPDDLYHILGKNGSILSPLIYRKKIASLLENGREITDYDKLNNHYKKVTREFFSEVPFAHMGFLNAVTLYRKDLINLKINLRKRRDWKIHLYQRKS